MLPSGRAAQRRAVRGFSSSCRTTVQMLLVSAGLPTALPPRGTLPFPNEPIPSNHVSLPATAFNPYPPAQQHAFRSAVSRCPFDDAPGTPSGTAAALCIFLSHFVLFRFADVIYLCRRVVPPCPFHSESIPEGCCVIFNLALDGRWAAAAVGSSGGLRQWRVGGTAPTCSLAQSFLLQARLPIRADAVKEAGNGWRDLESYCLYCLPTNFDFAGCGDRGTNQPRGNQRRSQKCC